MLCRMALKHGISLLSSSWKMRDKVMTKAGLKRYAKLQMREALDYSVCCCTNRLLGPSDPCQHLWTSMLSPELHISVCHCSNPSHVGLEPAGSNEADKRCSMCMPDKLWASRPQKCFAAAVAYPVSMERPQAESC